mmetsp:Transcript_136807/g.424934  ORF Transcript_136807/g.424934 Transcript_136807/m.424934 type:complete len:203 (+) Transcript_136807:577-1185(+)
MSSSPVLDPQCESLPGGIVVPGQAEALQKCDKEHCDNACVVVKQLKPVDASPCHEHEAQQVGYCAQCRSEDWLRQAVADPPLDGSVDARVTQDGDHALAHGKLGVDAQAQQHDEEEYGPEEATRHLRDGNRKGDESQPGARQAYGGQVAEVVARDARVDLRELVRQKAQYGKDHEAGEDRRPTVDARHFHGIEDEVAVLLPI